MADRTRVVPVTLCFVRSRGKLLLIRTGAHKPIFAGLWNGLGGHVEPGEDIRAAVCREVQEEAGIELPNPILRAVLHETGLAGHDRMVFVFTAELPRLLRPRASDEGEVAWFDSETLDWHSLVPDLRELLPAVLTSERVLFGTVHSAGHPAAPESYRLELR